jgi:hypothetical protein
MWRRPLHRLLAAGRAAAQALRRRLAAATRPAAAPLLTGILADLARTKPELLAENALIGSSCSACDGRSSGPAAPKRIGRLSSVENLALTLRPPWARG